MKKTFTISIFVRCVIFLVKGIWVRDVTGLENLPKNEPFIIAPNHSSYMDHFIVGSIILQYLKKKLYFIAKKEHFEGVSQKSWHRLWNNCITYIPIDRSKGEEALKTTLSYLKHGGVIVIYPEGTRSLTGKIQKGKTGVARLALWAKVPVVPVGIMGTFEILPKGKNIPGMKKATLHFGKPLYFNIDHNKKITKSLLRKITGQIMKEIAKLSNQKYNF
jgi:1-acyl-sn-glycerol-3-phosphate acyltransferase